MGLSSQPVFDPLVGSTVGGSFIVQARVGEGGMGVVYRAEQIPLGRPVALKVIHSALASDAKVVSRFLREAKIASQLKNPHTVTVFDFNHKDGLLYLAMELLEGESLHERLCRGPIEPMVAATIAAQVCRSLTEAHKKGIIHRDLKPDNIFLGTADDGTLLAKVLDYGLARVMSADDAPHGIPSTTLTQVGTIVGTPIYMSPEQARGKKLDARTDLYSMGVVLFEMLAGVAPFMDEDAVVVLGKHIREPVPRIGDVGDRILPPPALQVLVDKLLEKEPSKRPPDAAWVFQELKTYLRSMTEPGVQPPPVLDEISSPGRSVPYQAAALARTPMQGESGVQPRLEDPDVVDEWEDTAAGVPERAKTTVHEPRHPEAQVPVSPFESEPTLMMASGPSVVVDASAEKSTADAESVPAYRVPPALSLTGSELAMRRRKVPVIGLVAISVGVLALVGIGVAISTDDTTETPAPVVAPHASAPPVGRPGASVSNDPPSAPAHPPAPVTPAAGVAAPAPPPPDGYEPRVPHNGHWTGTFSSTRGELELSESGSTIIGTFEDGGHLEGHADGTILTFHWRQNEQSGRGILRSFAAIRGNRVLLLGTWGLGDSDHGFEWRARGESRTATPRIVRKNRTGERGSGLSYGNDAIFGRSGQQRPRKNR